jgi:hypothetical protein
VTADYLDARRRISRRIPQDGPLSWIRDSPLSITAVRALYHIKDDKELDAMANKALGLTVQQIRNEVAVYQDKIAVASSLYTCAECKKEIEDVQALITIRQNKSTALLCSPKCLLTYAAELVGDDLVTEEDETPSFEFSDSLELAEAL